MAERTPLDRIPKEGFIKLTKPELTVSGSDRTALIRKGNELFNAGAIENAKRIFLTARYGDGLTRVGDFYLEQEDHLEALRMYWLAPSPDKLARLLDRTAAVVQNWIADSDA